MKRSRARPNPLARRLLATVNQSPNQVTGNRADPGSQNGGAHQKAESKAINSTYRYAHAQEVLTRRSLRQSGSIHVTNLPLLSNSLQGHLAPRSEVPRGDAAIAGWRVFASS